MPKTMFFSVLHASMSKKDIQEYMRDLFRSGQYPTYVSIGGFDDDPRDLWIIPEAKALLDRAWETGFASLLQPNLPFEPGYVDGLWGALQFWVAVTGRATKNCDKHDLSVFITDYMRACRIGNAVCESVADGQSRTGI